jgi:hypothetical protein
MVQRHRNMPMEATLVVAMVMQRYRLDLIARPEGEGALQGHLAITSGHVKAPRSDRRESGKSAGALGDPEDGVQHLTCTGKTSS